MAPALSLCAGVPDPVAATSPEPIDDALAFATAGITIGQVPTGNTTVTVTVPMPGDVT